MDIPDSLFRLTKAAAAQEGRSLKSLVEEVLQEKLANGIADEPESPWMNGFGRTAHRRGKDLLGTVLAEANRRPLKETEEQSLVPVRHVGSHLYGTLLSRY